MAKLENRKMFANFPGFEKIVSNVGDLYSGIETLPERTRLDIAGQFLAQNPESFTGIARPGAKLPSSSAILVDDLKNLFGGISAGRQTDELLRAQADQEKQAKILDTSLDIYKESIPDVSDDKKTETEGFIEKINSYNKRIQAGEKLADWELKDLENLEGIIQQKGTGKYDVKDYIGFRDEKIEKADAAKDTTVLLEEAMVTLADPEMTTKASTDTLDIINRRLSLDLAQALTGNKSNFELEQLLASTPNLAADPEANRKILNILKFYADRTIAYGKFANKASNRAEYNDLVDEYDLKNSSPFSASSEYQQFKSGDDAFSGMNLDADEGSYVIEGQEQ
jgi:hypothetical protein